MTLKSKCKLFLTGENGLRPGSFVSGKIIKRPLIMNLQ